MTMFSGCYTAIVTPLTRLSEVDYEGLQRLVEFQVREGITGLLAVGTTGESPTLDWNEHNRVIERTKEYASEKCFTIAGTGSNSTQETIEATAHAKHIGVNCVLLVDPYYNGPSSMEIRREYVEPVARQFPDVQIIPYVIPGRTGTQLLPQDLAILHQQYPNVRTVKEATGDLENMKLTRRFCGTDYDILSGDDDKTFAMMTMPDINASGVISVASNVAPRAVAAMTHFIRDGKIGEARELCEALQPLFSIITVKTQEQTSFGPVTCRARNPLATKTLMNILGMPSGPCRQPLGRMTRNGLEVVLTAARKVYETNPQILLPIADYFDVNIQERLYNDRFWKGLTYA
ncbi:MAG TPA: 4-hydroxy-tetrahydrodipicolinate synthase [Candidatus Bathyarchaeia archaeon]